MIQCRTNDGIPKLPKLPLIAKDRRVEGSSSATHLGVARDIGKSRWLMFAQQSSQIPTAFLAVVAVWLSIVFASFGLYAPRNATVIVALFLGALSVGGAVLLIMELYAPFAGWIRIPSAPLRAALAQLGK